MYYAFIKIINYTIRNNNNVKFLKKGLIKKIVLYIVSRVILQLLPIKSFYLYINYLKILIYKIIYEFKYMLLHVL